MSKLTLGSLFDGSGGFPLGGQLSGIKPIWAGEIEPFPIRVTTKRLPEVKHLGDISKINGAEIEPVDIITFGSPCTDLSIAGKCAGLEGSKSSLFYQAIRIIKEMREKTNGEYPRYIVWENVCGAFSSNKGADFKSVIEEICKVKNVDFDVAQPDKWERAGEIVAEEFSLTWRVLDAQYWGVPQRRKRIYLVAVFRGECASKILFESEGVSRYPAESFDAWQRAIDRFEKGARDASELCLNDQGGNRMDVTDGVTGTLRAKSNHPPLVFDNHGQDSRYTGPIDTAQTVLATYGTGGNNQPFVVEELQTFDVRFTSEGTRNVRAKVYESEKLRTIDTSGNAPDGNQGGIIVVQPTFALSKNSHQTVATEEVASTLVASDYKDPPIVNSVNYTVRRLTPSECARLQGFPSWWCNDLETDEPTEDDVATWRKVFETQRVALGKSTRPKSENQIIKWLKNPHSDAAEYKLWGNGVALPCVVFGLSGIVHFDNSK